MASIASSPKGDESYDKWRAKDDMRTLLEAERIKKDTTRMKHAKRCAKEELAEMQAMKTLANS
ncbi:hypothetical protein D9M73_70810 [compost metagenome]